MSRSTEILIYRSGTSSIKKAWMNCVFSIVFGSAFFLILPFMKKAQAPSNEPMVQVQKMSPIIKVEKKKKKTAPEDLFNGE